MLGFSVSLSRNDQVSSGGRDGRRQARIHTVKLTFGSESHTKHVAFFCRPNRLLDLSAMGTVDVDGESSGSRNNSFDKDRRPAISCLISGGTSKAYRRTTLSEGYMVREARIGRVLASEEQH